jgi:hypothetical protein
MYQPFISYGAVWKSLITIIYMEGTHVSLESVIITTSSKYGYDAVNQEDINEFLESYFY